MIRSLLRAWWPYLAAGVAVLVAFCAGRASSPVKVEERLVEKVVVQEKVVERRVEVKVADTTAARRTVVDRVRYVYPDGTRIERERRGDALDVHAISGSRSAEVREAERVVYRDREVTKVVESARPLWRASLLAGVDLPRLHQPQLLGPIAFGAHVERRLVGPAFVGAWGVSSGQGGLTVGVEF